MALDQKNAPLKLLLLFAHPAQSCSEVNVPLFNVAKRHPHVTPVDLYAEYPDYHINVEREQQRLLDHDVVIFQFPLYWYSTPSILKEWQDLVLEYGFAYGSKGDALHGKHFMCALTAGGAEKAYHADGYNHFTIRELLQPLEQTADLIGMHYLPPFAMFGSRTAQDEGRVAQHLEDWQCLLDAMASGRVDPEEIKDMNTINELIKGLETAQ